MGMQADERDPHSLAGTAPAHERSRPLRVPRRPTTGRLDDVIRPTHGGAGDGACAAAAPPPAQAPQCRAGGPPPPVGPPGAGSPPNARTQRVAVPCVALCPLQRYGRDHAVATVRDAAIAAEVLAAHRRLSSDDKLQLYKYLQQATHGDCDVEQPSWINASGTQPSAAPPRRDGPHRTAK